MKGVLLGSSARSSGEFGTKVHVSVLASSQSSLSDIGSIQSDNLRDIPGVRTVREGPTFTYCPNAPKRWIPRVHTYSRYDIGSTCRRHLVNRVASGVTTSDVLEEFATRPLFYLIYLYQLTTSASSAQSCVPKIFDQGNLSSDIV